MRTALVTLVVVAAAAATPATATTTVGAASAPTSVAGATLPVGLSVSVGYAEDKETNNPNPASFPVPWAGAPDTIFLGGTVPGQTACGSLTLCYDTGAIRFDNTGTAPVPITNVSVDMHSSLVGGKVFNNLWGSFSVPPGKSVILAANPPGNNPSYDNFDTSGYPGNQCTPLAVAPTVTVTIGGVPTTLVDSTHVLDTGGIDAGYCKQNESIQWRPIGAAGVTTATLDLGPATATAPVGQQIVERATLLDGAGAGLPHAAVDFSVTAGPDRGVTGSAITDSQGHATLTLHGTADGEDLIRAQVTTVGTFAAAGTRVLWTENSASGWTGSDLGATAPVGFQTFDPVNDSWTIAGGASPSAESGDSGRLVATPMSAAAGIAARINSVTAPPGSAGSAGVTLRADNSTGDPFYSATLTAANTIVIRARPTTGAPSAVVANVAGSASAWLWLVHNGAGVTTYASLDGYVWDAVAGSTAQVDLGSAPQVGLIVDSGTPGQLASAGVADVVVSALPPAPSPPVPCPAPWSCADVGGPLPAGSQSFDPNGGRWTVDASGADITGTTDQFRFISQSHTGDVSVTARVDTQQATSSSAKAGVMLRASSDAAAPYYAVFVTPGTGIKVQRRLITGGTTSKLANPAGAAPAYLRVTRIGSRFTAFTSPDGSVWTPIAGSATTFNMPTSLLVGLAVTSHKVATLGETTVSDVQIS